MQTQLFKTNIRCSGCEAAVRKQLDPLPDLEWNVNLEHPDRILSTSGEYTPEQIIAAVQQAGFTAEEITAPGW